MARKWCCLTRLFDRSSHAPRVATGKITTFKMMFRKGAVSWPLPGSDWNIKGSGLREYAEGGGSFTNGVRSDNMFAGRGDTEGTWTFEVDELEALALD
jgi:hypothetical protein